MDKSKKLYEPFKYTGKGKKKFSVYVKNEKGEPKLIHFGHSDYQDFRQHKDEKRRASYLKRAKAITNKARGNLHGRIKIHQTIGVSPLFIKNLGLVNYNPYISFCISRLLNSFFTGLSNFNWFWFNYLIFIFNNYWF